MIKDKKAHEVAYMDALSSRVHSNINTCRLTFIILVGKNSIYVLLLKKLLIRNVVKEFPLLKNLKGLFLVQV